MRHTAQIGPFPIILRLPSGPGDDAGRPSAAKVALVYQTLRGPRHLGGFPVLLETQQLVHAELLRLTERPLLARSGGEAVAILFEAMGYYCPPELQVWGGCYALQRMDLGIIEQTARGPRILCYSTEAEAANLVRLPHRDGGLGDRRTDDWLRAREATYLPPPPYHVDLRSGEQVAAGTWSERAAAAVGIDRRTIEP